jgi:hypothetical protein
MTTHEQFEREDEMEDDCVHCDNPTIRGQCFSLDCPQNSKCEHNWNDDGNCRSCGTARDRPRGPWWS